MTFVNNQNPVAPGIIIKKGDKISWSSHINGHTVFENQK
jgi:hypothetical protein